MQEYPVEKMSLEEIICTDSWHDYEKIGITWTHLMLAKMYGYTFSLYIGDSRSVLVYMFLRYARSKGLKPQYLITSAPGEGEFDGEKCIGLEAYLAKSGKSDFIFAVPDAYFDEKILASFLHKVFPWWVPVEFEYLTREPYILGYVKEHLDEILRVEEMFGDDISRNTYKAVIQARIDHTLYDYLEFPSKEKYFMTEDDTVYRHLDDEIWVNCGAAEGDTIIHFLSGGLKFGKVYAYEADENAYNVLKVIANALPDETKEKIEIIKEYLDGNTQFDYVPTLINMDIEGAEIAVLNSLRPLIEKTRPVCAVCMYHRSEDLLEIPRFFLELSGEWKIYMRKYRSCNPNNINEFVLYGVPVERAVV